MAGELCGRRWASRSGARGPGQMRFLRRDETASPTHLAVNRALRDTNVYDCRMYRGWQLVGAAAFLACGPQRGWDAENAPETTGAHDGTSASTRDEATDAGTGAEDPPIVEDEGVGFAYALRDSVHVIEVLPEGGSVEHAVLDLQVPSNWQGKLDWSRPNVLLSMLEDRIVLWSPEEDTLREIEDAPGAWYLEWFPEEDALLAYASNYEELSARLVVHDLRGTDVASSEIEAGLGLFRCSLVMPDSARMFFVGPNGNVHVGHVDAARAGMPVVDTIDLGLRTGGCWASADGKWVSSFGSKVFVIPTEQDVNESSPVEAGTAQTCDESFDFGSWAPTESIFVFHDWRVLSGELCQGGFDDQWTQDVWLLDLRSGHVLESLVLAEGTSAGWAGVVGWATTPAGKSRLFLVAPAEGGTRLRIITFEDGGVNHEGSILVNAPELISAISFAPDGQRVSYRAGNSTEGRLHVARGPEWVPRELGVALGDPRPCVWSPDGAHVVCSVGVESTGTGIRRELWSYSWDDAEILSHRLDLGSSRNQPRFSPDGSWLVDIEDESNGLPERLNFVPFNSEGPSPQNAFAIELDTTPNHITWQGSPS
jgi:hypothetical protein